MKNLFHNEGVKTLAQTAQGQWWMPHLWNIHDQIVQCLEHPHLVEDVPVLSRDLHWVTFKGLLQPKLFCDSTVL